MTIFLGLTGSIGMGKSTTAQMFQDEGIPVHDSDATVHRLYSGEAAPLVEQAFPGTTKNGIVDRDALSKRVIGDEPALKKLESIIHPLVRRDEIEFRQKAVADGEKLAVLDTPLLFERGTQDLVDGIIVVTAPENVQRERVMARPGMTEEKFENLLNRQVPDNEKRQMADFIIDTSLGLELARKDVRDIIETVSSGNWTSGNKHNA